MELFFFSVTLDPFLLLYPNCSFFNEKDSTEAEFSILEDQIVTYQSKCG